MHLQLHLGSTFQASSLLGLRSMLIWSASAFCFLQGLRLLWVEIQSSGWWQDRRASTQLRQAAGLFQELEETLESGLVPQHDRWEALLQLAVPWSTLSYGALAEIRAQGGAMLPTLKRLRSLAEHHQEVLLDARSRSAQALAQTLVCLLLIPVFGLAIYFLLPAVQEEKGLWMMACLGSSILAIVGAVWLMELADQARWAGLTRDQRSWILSSQCAGERLLSVIGSGLPADIAWARAHEWLSRQCPSLSTYWGYSVWEEGLKRESSLRSPAARSLASVGQAVKGGIQMSLMEGRGCSERIESIFSSLRSEVRSHMNQEISLIPTRALQPMFVCIAPALFFLFGLAGWIVWNQADF